MKRSEMLTILRESIIYHMNHTGLAESDEEMYSNILEDLERAGISAPSVVFSGQGRNPGYYVDEREEEDV